MDDEVARRRLLETLTDADAVNRRLRDEAQRFTKLAQTGIDDSEAVRGLLQFDSLPRAEMDRLTTVWRSQADAGRAATHTLQEVRAENQFAYFGTSANSSTAAVSIVRI